MKLKSKIIVLAAGRSSRFGSPKPNLTILEKTLLQHQIDSLLQLTENPLIVLGFHSQKILEAHPDLTKNCQVIINPSPEEGQFSSLRLALEKTLGESVFILPVDAPAPKKEIWFKLENNSTSAWVVVPKYQDKGGHPVWLSPQFGEQLLSKTIPTNEHRLDIQIRNLKPSQYKSIEVGDPSVLVDLDTPADLESYLMRQTNQKPNTCTL
ncbi:MAG: nucleotidyltransferase family protein [Deltaproteobacteria bacterium]|nr:nucleotidyltransferase family protein [Deltaproteobacteria bacterium]